MIKYYLCFLFILFIFPLSKAEKSPLHTWTAKDPFEQKVLIENLGQYSLKDKAIDILFGARQDGMQYFFTKDGIWIKYIEKVERTEKEKEEFSKHLGEKEENEKGEEDNIVKYKFVDRFYHMEFVGAGLSTTISAEGKVPQYYSFCTEQKVNVQAKAYKKITYKNLYPNIDMEFYFPEDKQGFKYNFILHPGADISLIQIHYPLIKNIRLNNEGNLNIKSVFGDFTEHAPIANDPTSNRSLSCAFAVKNNTVSFSVPSYDKTKGLFIDPWTNTPVFTGGNNAFDVDWDLAGNVYVYGGRAPYQLTKFNSAGKQLWTYTTNFMDGIYYGDFAVDKNSGSVYLTDGFNFNGAEVKKVMCDGTLAATYPGNPSFREMWRIVFSRCANAAVIAGGGTSNNPAYTGCYLDTTLVDMKPVDVINSGGNGLHDMWGIALDATGNAYFCSAKTWAGTPGFDNIIYKVPIPALTPILWQAPTAYSFAEVGSVTYCSSSTNGFNGTAISNTSFYTYDSYILKKWNSKSGTLMGNASINGASQRTINFGGLAADECDHLFLGYNNSILQYDGNSMSQTGTLVVAGTVFDINLGNNNILYSCGHGFVTATQLNLDPCTILQVQDSITNTHCTNQVGSATITVSGGTPAYNITWNTTPVQTGPVVTNLPSGTYIATITDNSCPPLITTDTVVINLSGVFAATPVITNVKCNGASTGALAVTITGNVVPSYTWSTGSNVSGISNVPAGTYSVIIDGGNGCNMTLSLNVTEPPALTYTLSPGILKCFGDTTSISIAVAGGTPFAAPSMYTVTWNPPNVQGFAVHGLGVGNYGGFVMDSLGCFASFATSLTQPPQITSSFTFNSVCFGLPMQFTDQSNGGPFSWSWDFGDGTPLATAQNPQHTYASKGTYSVALTTITSNGCNATIVHSLIIDVPPQADFTGDNLTGCPTHTVNFKDRSSGQIVSWQWDFGNDNSFTGQFPPGAVTYNNFSPTETSKYSVSLTVTNANGCTSSVVKNNYILVYPRPQTGFEYSLDENFYSLNNTVHFYDHSIGANTVKYDLGDIFVTPHSVNYTAERNPVHQYENGDHVYYVTQWVANRLGCKDSITKPVQVKPNFSFYIPNSFSPNGDGVNEYFLATGTGIDNNTYDMMVYDRWGNNIFKSNDLEKGWDGKLNGSEVLEDAFAWKVSFKDIEGFNHEYQGTVTIVK